MPMPMTTASLPALHANSRSAAWMWGVAPSASPTTVDDGLTAYGCDSLPTHTARSSCGSMPARASALRAASMDIVMVSSSSPATAFSLIGNPPELSFQTLPTSAAGSR